MNGLEVDSARRLQSEKERDSLCASFGRAKVLHGHAPEFLQRVAISPQGAVVGLQDVQLLVHQQDVVVGVLFQIEDALGQRLERPRVGHVQPQPAGIVPLPQNRQAQPGDRQHAQ